jgi:hypothetical protein
MNNENSTPLFDERFYERTFEADVIDKKDNLISIGTHAT